jgi:hypothetical protein
MLHECHEAYRLRKIARKRLSETSDAARLAEMEKLPFSAWSKAATIGGQGIHPETRITLLRHAARRRRQGHTGCVEYIVETLRSLAQKGSSNTGIISVNQYSRHIERVVRQTEILMSQRRELAMIARDDEIDRLRISEEKLEQALTQLRAILKSVRKRTKVSRLAAVGA